MICKYSFDMSRSALAPDRRTMICIVGVEGVRRADQASLARSASIPQIWRRWRSSPPHPRIAFACHRQQASRRQASRPVVTKTPCTWNRVLRTEYGVQGLLVPSAVCGTQYSAHCSVDTPSVVDACRTCLLVCLSLGCRVACFGICN